MLPDVRFVLVERRELSTHDGLDLLSQNVVAKDELLPASFQDAPLGRIEGWVVRRVDADHVDAVGRQQRQHFETASLGKRVAVSLDKGRQSFA
eukprot:4104029-Prymnesium_polylepis.2